MAWTLTEAREALGMWQEAARTVATAGQSYRIGTRSLTRANLSEIQRMINYWRDIVDQLESGRGRGARVMRAVPRDL